MLRLTRFRPPLFTWRVRGWLFLISCVLVLASCSRDVSQGGSKSPAPALAGPAAASQPATTQRPATNAPAAPPRYPLVTPVTPVQGRVTIVNAKLRFVIVDFAFQQMPKFEQRLGVYRDGQRVGEVRISGPVSGTTVVADVMSGVAARGDLVRED